jgi:hypothetical protein
MQPTTTTRSVLVYGIIGLALLAAIVLGVQFAKNRSVQIASTNNQPQTAATEGQPPAAPEQGGGTTQDNPPPASDPNQNAEPQDEGEGTALGNADRSDNPEPSIRVPATGSEDVALMTIATSLAGFSAVVYFKSRRRLMTLN